MLQIGESIRTDYQGMTVNTLSALCEIWDLSDIEKPISGLGEPYYDGTFINPEGDMQGVLDVMSVLFGREGESN